jgi:multidrug efflux system outer membrane protein
MRRKLLVLCVAAALTACKVGPNYHRPSVPAPPQFRYGEAPPSPVSLGDVRWFDLFQDEALRALIAEALKANFDIRIAAQRIVEAQGQLMVVHSAEYPHVDAEATTFRYGVTGPNVITRRAFAFLTWELDIFGKLRRATEAARADLLATEETKVTVLESIIAQVAIGYFNLVEYDAEILIVQESIKARQQSLDLVIAREKGGVASLMDVDQARSLVQSAQSDLVVLERQRSQEEDLISFLLGRSPGPITRGRILTDQPYPPEVPAGLPSALLERRPDIRAAEERLVAANARVGVAKAAFYPSINLTAAAGVSSSQLVGIAGTTGPAYGFEGIFDLPIFDAGERAGNYKTAKAQHEELLLQYLSTIFGAFRDVSDALIAFQKAKEFVASQKALTDTLRDQNALANARWAGGVTSYLEVLDTQRQLLTSEQLLAQAQRDVLTSIVQLYQALGGGWR